MGDGSCVMLAVETEETRRSGVEMALISGQLLSRRCFQTKSSNFFGGPYQRKSTLEILTSEFKGPVTVEAGERYRAAISTSNAT
jgi:hypothetical protein